ncbi:MAG: ATP synthase F1 subunit delta [Leptospiraceae bacterium]|nr:ATP synthase F1 subunit delta [Leptospiraceae bacterium]
MQVDGKIAAVYASALFELVADRQSQLLEVEETLTNMQAVFAQDAHIWKFFASPVVKPDHKVQVIRKVFAAANLDKTLVNYLCLLALRRRIDALPEIVREFQELVDEKLARKHVTVASPRPLDARQQEALRKALGDHLKRSIILKEEVRPELIGGLVIHAGDVLIDTSMQSKLKRLRTQMLDQKIFGEKYYEN